MKVVNRKKLASTIVSAVAAVAAITSVSAFAEAGLNYKHYYNLTAHGSDKASFAANLDYMYFNTRPSPPGGVNLTITGYGLPEKGITYTFPAQVSRTALMIETPEVTEYDVVISANSYATSGILFVKTSDSPNEPFYS